MGRKWKSDLSEYNHAKLDLSLSFKFLRTYTVIARALFLCVSFTFVDQYIVRNSQRESYVGFKAIIHATFTTDKRSIFQQLSLQNAGEKVKFFVFCAIKSEIKN